MGCSRAVLIRSGLFRSPCTSAARAPSWQPRQADDDPYGFRSAVSSMIQRELGREKVSPFLLGLHRGAAGNIWIAPGREGMSEPDSPGEAEDSGWRRSTSSLRTWPSVWQERQTFRSPAMTREGRRL